MCAKVKMIMLKKPFLDATETASQYRLTIYPSEEVLGTLADATREMVDFPKTSRLWHHVSQKQVLDICLI